MTCREVYTLRWVSDATNVIPIIVGHGRFIRREITPTITFWTDDQFNTRLPPSKLINKNELPLYLDDLWVLTPEVYPFKQINEEM